MRIAQDRTVAAATLAMLAMACASLGCAATTSTSWTETPAEQAVVPAVIADSDIPQDGTAGKLREPIEESVPIAGTDLVRGRSTVTVEAPIAAVRDVVLDYGSYAEFMPHYAASRVLGRTPEGGHQVYMKWVALHGAMKMWARFDMSGAQKQGDEETYKSELVEGNVRAAVAIWRLAPVGANRTKLSLEVFLQPRMPMPSTLLNGENIKGATKGVTAMRDRCEGLSSPSD